MHSLILFLCGYFLSVSLLKWNAHQRIALVSMTLWSQTYARLLLAVIGVAALLSALMPNIVCTMLLLPILTEMPSLGNQSSQRHKTEYHQPLFFGLMYGVNIGGMATLIGTPTNVLFANLAPLLVPTFSGRFDFVHWFAIGAPCAVVLVGAAWVYLLVVTGSWRHAVPHNRGDIDEQLRALGTVTKGERFALIAMLVTICAWLTYKRLRFGSLVIEGWADLLGISQYINDSVIAVFVMVGLLLIPVDWKRKEFLLDIASLKKYIPWKPLLLIIGGYGVALVVRALGITHWLTTALTGITTLPSLLLYFTIALVVSLLTEVAFNVVIVSIMLPVLHALGTAVNIEPLPLMVAGTLSASCAFMTPIATSTNAMVYATGKIRLIDMLKIGWFFNVIASIIIALTVYTLVPVVFGV